MFRLTVAVSAGVMLFGASGCGLPGMQDDSDAAEQSDEDQSAGLEQFDPCTFFKPEELKSWDLSTNAEDSTQFSWEPTCRWSGSEITLDLSKNAEETVDSYEASGNWGSYEKQRIGARSAAVAQVPGAAATGDGCNVLVDAGGGVAIYQITADATKSVDACGELKEIAESTASRLPA